MLARMSATDPPDLSEGWSDDAGYLTRTVTLAERVTSVLPAGSPVSWRRLTYRAVLSAVLRDAVENDTSGLGPDDAETLGRFVRDAAGAAGMASPEHRDDAFEIVLGALLEDWVDNWEPDTEDEPDD